MTEPTSRAPTDNFRGTDTVNHGDDGFGDVSTAVVVALAEERGVDPLELDDPLHDWVDPDALDAVVSSIENGHVTFDVGNHTVRIDATGAITIDPVE